MKLYNSLTGQKEKLVPTDGEITMYVCGITPYDHSHLGHAMSYIIFDVLRRYLEFTGYRVKFVQNYTDIDDKIIARSQQLGISFQDLAERYIREYEDLMQALNVKPALVYPRATQEIPAMIEMIQGLIDKSYAYAAKGNVYFRVHSKADYGKLARRSTDSLLSGARVEPGEEKENPLDFALWKAAKPGEPSWESPWGPGRPGWHIECSAMSLRYLGETIDIHGGGADLVFPHHDNEIAQTEAYTGTIPFARHWMHHGLLQMGEEKMSKSLENMIPIESALRRYGADAIRLFILSSHYRNPLTYREESLAAAQRGVQRLRQARHLPSTNRSTEMDATPYRQQFIEALDDDLNTAQAVAVLFDLARDINRVREEGMETSAAQQNLQELAGILGLTLSQEAERSLEAAPYIELLIEIRDELRRERNFALADRLRERLAALGVVIEDTPEGARWHAKAQSLAT